MAASNERSRIERRRAPPKRVRVISPPRLNPNPVIKVGRGGEVRYVNRAAERLFPDLVVAGVGHRMLANVAGLFRVLPDGDEQEVVQEVRIGERVYEEHISYVPEGDLLRISALDITERKKTQAMTEQVRRHLELTLAAAAAGILTLDAEGNHTLVNPAAASLLGYTAEELIGRHAHDLWQHSRADGTAYPVQDSPIYQTLKDGQIRRHDDEVFWRKDGTPLPVEYTSAPLRGGQAITGVVVMFVEITQRKRAAEALYALATTDSLTGVANRRAFMQRLESEVTRARRYRIPLALIMYDLDHFKRVNDTYGHAIGDAVLKDVTRLVKTNLRAVDVVARWGGEEFMILAPQSDVEGARRLANKLRTVIASRVFASVQTVTASFGVAGFEPHDGATSLLKKVDDALYKAKEKGRNRIEVISTAGIAQMT